MSRVQSRSRSPRRDQVAKIETKLEPMDVDQKKSSKEVRRDEVAAQFNDIVAVSEAEGNAQRRYALKEMEQKKVRRLFEHLQNECRNDAAGLKYNVPEMYEIVYNRRADGICINCGINKIDPRLYNICGSCSTVSGMKVCTYSETPYQEIPYLRKVAEITGKPMDFDSLLNYTLLGEPKICAMTGKRNAWATNEDGSAHSKSQGGGGGATGFNEPYGTLKAFNGLALEAKKLCGPGAWCPSSQTQSLMTHPKTGEQFSLVTDIYPLLKDPNGPFAHMISKCTGKAFRVALTLVQKEESRDRKFRENLLKKETEKLNEIFEENKTRGDDLAKDYSKAKSKHNEVERRLLAATTGRGSAAESLNVREEAFKAQYNAVARKKTELEGRLRSLKDRHMRNLNMIERERKNECELLARSIASYRSDLMFTHEETAKQEAEQEMQRKFEEEQAENDEEDEVWKEDEDMEESPEESS